jgi:long-chain acyl-CoA synthetase
MELLLRLLERTERRVLAIVRARDDIAARRRIDHVLETILPPQRRVLGRRVRAIAGDIEQPGLGLSRRCADELMRDIDCVVHCAAAIDFELPLAAAHAVNVLGTRHVMSLAERAPGLRRLIHVSTAFVAGDRDGLHLESESDVGQRPRNSYEQTKLAAEALVASSGLPATILRPSIVVGDSRTGWTLAFNVVYRPLRGFSRGVLPVIPGDPDARMDIVPIDTVADALFDLVTGERWHGGTIHVVSGSAAPTNRELVALAAVALGRRPARFVAFGTTPLVEEIAGPFAAYMHMHGVFDAARGHALGFRPPPLADYFPALMDYARLARWGKRPLARWRLAGAMTCPPAREVPGGCAA